MEGLSWQGHMTCGKAELEGLYDTWKVLVGSWTMNRFLTRGIGGEWNDDTWPNQWLPHVTWTVV
jgi:hypothetical protein